ncbi:MAG: amidohydrolase [Candidatus Heimdallarchaeota archaeon]|nr:amidohydrolase [Candidatus Heimdallarchaeota archaeon]
MINADLILYNGTIHTLDKKNTSVSAIASYDGKIIAVGDNNEVLSHAGENTERIDLKGKTVIPGLIDSHSHIIAQGIVRNLFIDLSKEAGINSIADIQNTLRNRAVDLPEGTWIIGYQEDDSKLLEKRHPTRWELDEISDKHPVMVETIGGHFRIVNSFAFDAVGISEKTRDPIGGKFDRDENGHLSGGVHEKAIELVLPSENKSVSDKIAYTNAKEILEEGVSQGLTCIYECAIHYLIGPRSQIKAALDLKNKDELPMRIRFDITLQLMNELDALGLYRGFGDDWIRICGLKYFFDGAVSGRTAALTKPYTNKPDFYGVMATNEQVARDELEAAYKKGFRISAHANGDKAILLYLDIIERLQNKYPREDPRNRDIHCTVVSQEIVDKMKKLEILPSIFGPYVYYHGDKLLPAFGEDRAEWMFAAKSFLESGNKVAAHSDHPCAPMAPLMGIHALVNRKTIYGKWYGKSQQISALDALRLYTINAAFHSFDEEKIGSLETGKFMDLVVLNGDILSIDTEYIKDIQIMMTMIDGKVVYQSID